MKIIYLLHVNKGLSTGYVLGQGHISVLDLFLASVFVEWDYLCAAQFFPQTNSCVDLPVFMPLFHQSDTIQNIKPKEKDNQSKWLIVKDNDQVLNNWQATPWRLFCERNQLMKVAKTARKAEFSPFSSTVML